MATFYIDPTAGSGGTGTFASPFDSWADVTPNGANTYLQKEGTTHVGTVTISGDGAGVGTELVIGVYAAADGARITDGSSRALINANGASYAILTEGATYLIIDGMECYGADGTSGTIHTGGPAGGHHHQTIKNCLIRDHTDAGGEAAGIKFFADNFTATDNIIRDMEGEGIYGEGDDMELARNDISGVSLNSLFGDGIQIAETQMSTNNPYVHHNTVDHSDTDVKQGIIFNDTLGISTGGRCEFNTVIGPPNSTTTWGIHVGWPGILVKGNLIQNFARAIDVSNIASPGGTVIIGNIIATPSVVANTRGINFFSDGGNSKVYNNVVVNTTGTFANATHGIHSSSADAGCDIRNNIVVGWKTGLAVSGAGVEDYNDLFGNQTSISGASLGANSITGDPLFVNAASDFHLNSGSPCIDAGVDPGVTVTTFDELTMTAPFDIGAYRYLVPGASVSLLF